MLLWTCLTIGSGRVCSRVVSWLGVLLFLLDRVRFVEGRALIGSVLDLTRSV